MAAWVFGVGGFVAVCVGGALIALGLGAPALVVAGVGLVVPGFVAFVVAQALAEGPRA